MEEPTFLLSVHKIVGCIQVQPDLPRRSIMGFDECIHQQFIQPFRICHNALVTALWCLLRVSQLEAIQRARAGQGMVMVPLAHPHPAQEVLLARQHRKHKIIAQCVMVIEVFVAQGMA